MTQKIQLKTRNYYPGGLSFSQLNDSEETDRLHSGKELDKMNGLNWYDFSARHFDPAYGQFTTPDPLAEKTPWLSPYAYCMGNPVRYIDPTGMKWKNPEQVQDLLFAINERIIELQTELEQKTIKAQQFNEKGKYKKAQKTQEYINELNTRIANLQQSISDIEMLDKDNNTYELCYDADGYHHVRMDDNGIIIIEYSSTATSIHEITHIRQALNANSLSFMSGLLVNPYWYNNSGNKEIEESFVKIEVEAYQMQYSYDKSFPGKTKSLNGITIKSVGNIRDGDGRLVYPRIYNYLNNYSR